MTETVRPQDIQVELEDAIAAENAANAAVEAMETAARQGASVDPGELSQAAGTALLRRLRREQLEANVTAAAERATAVERAAALDELAARAAADARLDPDHLRRLEQAAQRAATEYREALRDSDRAFHALVNAARSLDLPVLGKDSRVPDALVAGSEWRSGRTVRYSDPARIRLGGVEYAAAPSRSFSGFARWVAGLE